MTLSGPRPPLAPVKGLALAWQAGNRPQGARPGRVAGARLPGASLALAGSRLRFHRWTGLLQARRFCPVVPVRSVSVPVLEALAAVPAGLRSRPHFDSFPHEACGSFFLISVSFLLRQWACPASRFASCFHVRVADDNLKLRASRVQGRHDLSSRASRPASPSRGVHARLRG